MYKKNINIERVRERVNWVLDCYFLLTCSFTSGNKFLYKEAGVPWPPLRWLKPNAHQNGQLHKNGQAAKAYRDGVVNSLTDHEGKPLFGKQIARLVWISTHSTSRTCCMSREAVPLRRGWPVGASHLLPGTHRTRHRERGLLREPCRRAAAVVAIQKDLLQSSGAGAAETWRPFELTAGQLLDSTLRTDRLPWKGWEGLSHIAAVAASACRIPHRIGCPMWACQIHRPANANKIPHCSTSVRSQRGNQLHT